MPKERSAFTRHIMIFLHMLCSLIISCLCISQQKQTVMKLVEKAANLRRNLVPTNAMCRSVSRVMASGLCSQQKFDYKICSFCGYSTMKEIWLEDGFERLENFDERSCVAQVEAVCMSYVASSKASCILSPQIHYKLLPCFWTCSTESSFLFVSLFLLDRRWKLRNAST